MVKFRLNLDHMLKLTGLHEHQLRFAKHFAAKRIGERTGVKIIGDDRGPWYVVLFDTEAEMLQWRLTWL